MIRKSTILFFSLLTFCIAGEAVSESNDLSEVMLEAFGGYISVPGYMKIIVKKGMEESFEIRMLKKMGSEGDLRAIIIKRPSKPYKLGGTKLVLVEKYVVNEFSVDLYKPSISINSSILLSASVTRCGETGQFIMETKQQLDHYLIRVPSADCNVMSQDKDGKK